MGIMSKIFGTRSQREVKRLQPLVAQIEALGPDCQKLTDGELAAKTKEFQERYQNGETLDALLPEAFAVCREAADRVLGMRPYPVQLIGGIVLHQGRIAEMKTGVGYVEGKKFIHYRAIKGTSEYSTKEMSVFLDGIISECQEVGIETDTPEQIARYKEAWHP